MNLYWMLTRGILFAMVEITVSIMLCSTIIGIPAGIRLMRWVPRTLWPWPRLLGEEKLSLAIIHHQSGGR